MRIYLADLGHNLLTVSSDVYPMAIANLATYLGAHSRLGSQVETRIFREPQDLKTALDEAPPDVLGLSNYAWNEELSKHFAAYAKRLNPATLVCMGGPNYPLVDSVREEFLRSLSGVDVYLNGPTYEGERVFQGLVERFDEVGRRIEGVFEAAAPGVHFVHPRTGQFVMGEEVPRIRELDEIPSPYLAGLLDPYLETGYFPLLQITRGCPFTCTFCNSGVRSNSKVFAHTTENVQADLVYLAERIRPETTLAMADDNFGMYEQDLEIADFIGHLQKKYGWPRYIRTTTGKNKGERIIEVMRKVGGALPMTSAVQSMNPQVLKNIKRSNIKLETYAKIQDELRAQGMQSYGELIMCLPGETRETFLKAIEDFLDTGAKRVSAHQLMLLHGAELSDPESREKFGFETRWRMVARNIGNYTGEPVVEVEEMVVATPDFSYEDYLYVRVFHLLLTIYFYEGNFDEPFAWAKLHGLKEYDLVRGLKDSLDQAPAGLRKVLDDFVRESEEELFESRDECLAWSGAHYHELVDGTLGGNLLSKYSMIGRFYATEPAITYIEQVIERTLNERGTAFEVDELRTISGYMRAVMLHAPFEEQIAREVEWTTVYDVDAWAADGYGRPLSDFRHDAPQVLRAVVEPEKQKLINAKIDVFGEHPAGLGKFTRTMFARDLRRAFVHERDEQLLVARGEGDA